MPNRASLAAGAPIGGAGPSVGRMNAWLTQVFTAGQAAVGGVIRRARQDIETYGGGMDPLIDHARQQQWHVIETGDQVVVLCHQGDLRIHC